MHHGLGIYRIYKKTGFLINPSLYLVQEYTITNYSRWMFIYNKYNYETIYKKHGLSTLYYGCE